MLITNINVHASVKKITKMITYAVFFNTEMLKGS